MICKGEYRGFLRNPYQVIMILKNGKIEDLKNFFG